MTNVELDLRAERGRKLEIITIHLSLGLARIDQHVAEGRLTMTGGRRG